MRRVSWCLVTVILLSCSPGRTPMQNRSTEAVVSHAGSVLRFEANRGQFDESVAFLARRNGYAVQLPARGAGAVVSLRGATGEPKSFSLTFVGGASPHPVAEDSLPSYSNYFVGDRARWRAHVPHYGRVRYAGVYPGIDVVYHGDRPGAPFEFDLMVHPGADPGAARIRVIGTDRLEISDGAVELENSAGRMVLKAPEVFQDVDGVRRLVAGRFRVTSEDELRFEVGEYDRTRILTIDPVVVAYSSYVGGSGSETATDMAVDAQGMIYVAGQTMSTDFPTLGPVQSTLASAGDAYVLKVNPALSGAASLIYATYLGSTGNDAAEAVAVDGSGRAYVAGLTHAGDFPVTTNAFKATFTPSGGNNDDESDAFATILAASGDALVYSTFFGGNRDEEAMGIHPNGADEFYLGGTTDGGTFPTTTSAFDQAGQIRSAFVSVLNWSTNTLRYSTVYHAGPNIQLQVRGLAVDGTGRAHITGLARGSGLPTPNGFQTTFPLDATGSFGQLGSFLAVFDPAQSGVASLVYGTYLGAGDVEDVATDAQGRSVVTGSTSAPGFPTTSGALQTVCGDFIAPGGQNLGCARDAFVMRIDPGQSGAASLMRSTRLGGTRADDGFAVVVDANDSVVVTGSTSSAGFPTATAVNGGSSARPDGEFDAFVLRLSPQLNAMGFVARLGGVVRTGAGAGSASDQGTAVAVATDGAVCLAGHTVATDFPIVRGFDGSVGGFGDAFVAKLGVSKPPCVEELVGVLDGRDFDWEPMPELCFEGPFPWPGGIPRRCPPPECPRCGPSGAGALPGGELPQYLRDVYNTSGPVLGAGGRLTVSTKRPLPAATSFIRAVNATPLGRHFTPSVRERTARILGTTRGTAIGLAQQRRAAFEALNAIALDWRLGGEAAESKQGAPNASAALRDVGGKGTVNVEVTSGLPAWPSSKLVQQGWPLATFSVPGRGRAMTEVSLDVSWMSFPENSGAYRVLAWNGRRYRAITPRVDAVRGRLMVVVPIGELLVVVKLLPCRG